ncbi:MAG: hypothetical protein IJH82_05685 [Lachnospiraceae bacterium]|nr:hypothetical protein [Lachnospiraceae bacterium]
MQDLDAFNISRLHNLNYTPIQYALEDYYIEAEVFYRYSIFEERILAEYGSNSFLQVAETFALSENWLSTGMNSLFQTQFGVFDHATYGEYIAQAFANKISYYKQTEPEEE